MKKGEVLAIYICADKGEPMQQLDEVKAIANKGLEGDRYETGKGAYSQSKRVTVRQVSLIELEAIVGANADFGTDFTVEDTRRNILTKNVDLNELVGVEFIVGGVAMLGIELCTPCDRPSKLSGKPGFNEAFTNRGGLRAQILEDGVITVGDEIATKETKKNAADPLDNQEISG